MPAELETIGNRLQILECLRLASLFPNHTNSYPQAKNEKEKSKFDNSLDKLQKGFRLRAPWLDTHMPWHLQMFSSLPQKSTSGKHPFYYLDEELHLIKVEKLINSDIFQGNPHSLPSSSALL